VGGGNFALRAHAYALPTHHGPHSRVRCVRPFLPISATQTDICWVGNAWWAKGWRIARNATSRRTSGSASPAARSAVGASTMVAWVGMATRSRTLKRVCIRSVSNLGLSPLKATPVSRILHSCIQADDGRTRYTLLRVQRVADRPRARPPSCQFWH
jgi:hypothetical protein